MPEVENQKQTKTNEQAKILDMGRLRSSPIPEGLRVEYESEFKAHIDAS